MIDTVNGKVRIRAWPRKRPKEPSPEDLERREQFAAYQWAAKYISPQQMVDVMNGREGTPILPRDALTAMWSGRLMAFVTSKGKVLWPLPARIDTSEALDTITQTEGDSIRRGPEGWEAYNPATNAEAVFHAIADVTVTSNVPQIVFTDLAGWRELFLMVIGLDQSAISTIQFQLSTTNGATWWNTSGDYVLINADGSTTNSAANSLHTGTSNAPRSGLAMLTLNVDGKPAVLECINRADVRLFMASTDPVNALRVFPSAGGNFTAGRVVLLAR